MADVTIASLLAATPSSSAVIPFSDGSSTNKVNINSIVGLTTNGAYRGTLQRGSYGSLTIGGSNGGYSGIDFTDASSTFMVRNSDGLAGIYKTNNTWAWYFDGSGNLVTGTVPWANVSGKPTIPNNTGVAKAWVRFNGPGTSVPANGADVTNLISASFNINQLIFVSQNRWRAYFTTPFANASYLCGAGSSSANNMAYNLIAGVSFTTTYVEFYTPNGGNVNTSSTLLPTGTTSFIVYSL